MSAVLAPLARGLFEALLPLGRALESPARLRLLIRQLGWDVAVSEALLAELPLANKLPALLEQGEALVESIAALEGTKDDDIGGVVVQTLELVTTILGEIEALDGWAASGAQLPAQAKDPTFWAELAGRLPGFLIARWLRARKPVLYELLHLVGVVSETVVILDDGEEFVRRSVDWSLLSELVQDPVGTLAGRYAWGEADWAHDDFLEALRRLCLSAGVRGRRESLRATLTEGALYASDSPALAGLPRSPALALPFVSGRTDTGGTGGASAWAELGLLLAPAPASPRGEAITGLYLGNLSYGETEATLPLAEGWALRFAGGADASGSVGVDLQPDSVEFIGSAPRVDARLAITGQPPTPTRLLGAEQGLRLELRALELGLAVAGSVSAPELILDAATSLGLVIEPSEGDALLGTLLGGQPLDIGADVALRWSSQTGLSLAGELGLRVLIPLGKTLGPVTLHQLELAVRAGTSGASIAAGLGFGAVLGPFAVSVDGIGIEAAVQGADEPGTLARFGSGEGALGLRLAFLPPRALGLAIDASVVSGGGYLDVDHERGRYAGVFDVDVLGVGVTAIAIIETKLERRPGWSLLLSLSARFSGLQLGYGFTLEAVGGLVGLNRGVDLEALGEGVRTGALASILFPEDPVANAPRILSDMEAVFPTAPGQYVFGPVVEIGWGTPTLVSIQLGVVVQLPEPLTISLIGSLAAVLPKEEAKILALRVDFAGSLDLTKGSLSVDAALRDSTVAGLALTGAMALRASFGAKPNFLFAFGGFHPKFTAPEGFPKLDRLAISLDTGDNLRVSLGGYFALTSNTVQFGAFAHFWAKAVGFVAEGGTSFNALIRFSPFSFAIDLEVFVSIRAGKVELLGVRLSGELTGPNPWKVVGRASFKLLGVKTSLKVKGEFGRRKSVEPTPRVDLEALVAEALAESDAWRSVVPAQPSPVILAEEDETEEASSTAAAPLRVHPAGSVELRQRVAPLGVPLERYGNAELRGDRHLVLDRPRLGGEGVDAAAVRPIDEPFAAAQFFDLDADEKLRAPSFEDFPAGLRLGDEQLDSVHARSLRFDHERSYCDPRVRGAEGSASTEGAPKAGASADLARRFAAARRPRAKPAPGAAPFTLEPARWTSASASGRPLDAEPSGFFAARESLRARIPDAERRGRVARLRPSWEPTKD